MTQTLCGDPNCSLCLGIDRTVNDNEIVKKLSEMNPETDEGFCFFCLADLPRTGNIHKNDCLWVDACNGVKV